MLSKKVMKTVNGAFEISTADRFKGIRIVGIFNRTECVGHAIIDLNGPDAFDYNKVAEQGLRVLVV